MKNDAPKVGINTFGAFFNQFFEEYQTVMTSFSLAATTSSIFLVNLS